MRAFLQEEGFNILPQALEYNRVDEARFRE
jgi:hypothetical protein